MSGGRVLESLNAYFDDFSVGDRIVSQSRELSAEDIDVFSKLSGDHHPLHTDDEFAAKGPFGERIAQGVLTLALATGLEYALVGSHQDSKILAFYGMDRVRFVKPLFIGDAVHVEGEVIACDAKDDKRGVVTIREEIKNQRGDTVAAFEKRLLYRRRNAS